MLLPYIHPHHTLHRKKIQFSHSSFLLAHDIYKSDGNLLNPTMKTQLMAGEEVQEVVLAVSDFTSAVGHPVHRCSLRNKGRQARRQDHTEGSCRLKPKLSQADTPERAAHHGMCQDRRHLRSHRPYGMYFPAAVSRSSCVPC